MHHYFQLHFELLVRLEFSSDCVSTVHCACVLVDIQVYVNIH